MHRKRGMILLLIASLALCLINIALAGQEKSIDRELHYGEIITVAGVDYLYTVNADGLSTFISETGGGIIVYNGTCEERDKIMFCVNDVIYDYHNTSNDKDYYKGTVEIYQDTAELKITRTFDDTDLALGQTFTITVRIENMGDSTATDILYKDPWQNFSIIGVNEPCFAEQSTIYYTGKLLRGKSATCKVTLKAMRVISFKSIANVSYHNNIQIVEEESDDEKIEVSQSLVNISLSVADPSVEVGDYTNITLSLFNEENEDFSGTLQLDIPSLGFLLISKSYGLIFQDNKPTWKGTITSDEKKNFTISIQARRGGNYTITAEASFFYQFKPINSQEQTQISVQQPELAMTTNIEKRYQPGQNILLKIFAKNTNKAVTLQNIKINVQHSLLDASRLVSRSELRPDNSMEVINQELTLPKVNTKTTYPITLDIVYQTNFDQVISKQQTFYLIIIPDGYEDNQTEEEKNASQNISATSTKNESKAQQQPKNLSIQQNINRVTEVVHDKNILGDLFKNPLLIIVDLIVLILIGIVAHSIFKGKQKPLKPEEIFVDEEPNKKEETKK